MSRPLPPVVARWLLPGFAYLALAAFFTWPAVLHPVRDLPGAPRTDLWDTLWSLWYFAERVCSGQAPLRVDGLLNHPDGGTLWVADPVNAVLALPFLPWMGVAATWTLLVLGHVVFAGLAAHRLGEAVSGGRAEAGWVAGTAYASAPLLLAHIHNGASEAVATGWLALAALALWRLREAPSPRRAALAGLALAVCTVASWYGGVCAFLLLGVVLLAGPARRWVFGAALVGVLAAAPVAVLARRSASAEDNVVGIKTDKEVATVRRTIGPADPLAYVMPGDYRSPDFRELSQYGEEYVHCPYLGWVLLVASAAGLRRRGAWPWAVAGLLGAVLAMGPVLAQKGAPVILPGRLAVPLPYLLLERLPGFDGLSLLWRLAQLPVLAVSVLAALAAVGRPRLAAAIAVGAVLEARFVSPMAGLPETTDATLAAPIHALAAAPEGAVMNFPVAGGRAVLYEQTVHHKPLTGGLNFPNNTASRAVWKVAMEQASAPGAQLRAAVAAEARRRGVRYLVVHTDAMVRPDMHDQAVKALRAALTPLAEGQGIRVYELYE